jgi:hypothetical protein
MIAEGYLSRSRLFRRLKNGSHGQLIERYTARLVEEGLGQECTWRSLSLVGDLMTWIASSGSKVADIDERMVERYLRNRARKRFIHPVDRPALKRFLSVLREVGMIAPAEPPRITPADHSAGPDTRRVQRPSKRTRFGAEEHRPTFASGFAGFCVRCSPPAPRTSATSAMLTSSTTSSATP